MRSPPLLRARALPALALAGAAIAAAAVAGGSDGTVAQAGADGQRPNVVVVMTDDQRPDTLRFMPNVRALEGSVYQRSYLVQPLCCPARMSFLTGQTPSAHGITTNRPDVSPGLDRVRELEARSLPTWLEDAGYTTGFTGRYLNAYPWGSPYVPDGWDEWNARVNSGAEFRTVDNPHFDGQEVHVPGGHDTEVNADWAVDFIRRHAGEGPFFLSVLPLAPHSGFRGDARPSGRARPLPTAEHRGRMAHLIAPGEEGRRSSLEGKARMLRPLPRIGQRRANVYWRRKIEALLGVDEMVGRIRAALESTGEWERTVLIFTSDNGFQLGEHRLWGKDLPYEETSRVPLVVRGPGFEPGHTDKLVANVDLPITIAHLAGARPTLHQHGRPLWAAPRGRLVLSGTHQGKRPWRAIVGRRYAFVNWAWSGTELYDLHRDPGQLRPIPGRRPFKRTLNQALRQAG